MLGQTVYELLVKISGDASNLKSELDKSGIDLDKFGENLKGIGKNMSIAGMGILGSLGATVKKTADAGDQFDKMSKRTGVAVEDLSALAYAADMSGTDIGTLENSLRFLAQGIGDAANETGTAKDAFEKLGISVTDTEGNLRPTVDVMKEAATALGEVGSETEKVALATDMFGSRYGTQLLPMLREGGQGIEDLMNKAHDLNIVISTESAIGAADFNDRMSELQSSLAATGRAIGDTLIPALIPFIEKLTEIMVKVSEWTEKNPKLVETIGKIGIVLAVGGPVLIGLGYLTQAIKAIGTISAVGSPIGALLLAVGAVVIAFENWDKIKEIVSNVIDRVKEIINNAVDFLSGIKDRIKNIIDTISGFIGNILKKIGLVKEPEINITTDKAQVSLEKIPIHQHGIDYVPKTGLALIHEGEAVLNKMDAESYRKGNMGMSYNPSISITVQGDGDESKIRRAVEQALNESARQFRRTGYELIPGMG
jgi:TP901 family phage tail tape measure protein